MIKNVIKLHDWKGRCKSTTLNGCLRLSLTLLISASLVALTGCSRNSKISPVEPRVDPAPQILVQLERPAPLKLQQADYIVLSAKYLKKAEELLEYEGSLICLTPTGYQSAASNMAELRRYIGQSVLLMEMYEKQIAK